MKLSRSGILAVAAGGLFVGSAGAQGFFRDIFQGLDYGATPISQTTIPRVNGSRVGQLRVVPNRLGQGYRMEFNRNFGADQFGRPEIYDAGPFELELQGNVEATAQYTTRFFPIGSLEVNASNLAYSMRSKTGAQDFEIAGTINMASNVEVNPLGFYEMQLNITNTNSVLDADGLAVAGDDDTDFNVGPITVKGNIFWDAGVATLAAIGVDTTELESVFPASPVNELGDQIRARFTDSPELAGGVVDQAKQLDSARTFLGSGIPSNADIAAIVAQIAQAQLLGSLGSIAGGGTGGIVPEPTTFVLLASGVAVLLRRR